MSMRDFLAARKRRLVSRLVHPDIERIEIKLNEILARPPTTILESAPDAQIRVVEKFAVESFGQPSIVSMIESLRPAL